MIPRLILTGAWVPPDKRGFHPLAVVLEYIPNAVSLEDIDPEALACAPEVYKEVVRAVDSFAGLGVVHTDMIPRNVLFTPPDRPERGVVIDFGCAGIRGEAEESEWLEAVHFERDEARIRICLKQKGIIDLNV